MSEHECRDDDEVQNAIRNLFVGCAPEKSAELENLWQQFSPKFRLFEDLHGGERIIIAAGAYRYVHFNHRVLRAFWIAGYAAWEGFNAVQKSVTSGTALDLARLRELLTAFEAVISSDSPKLEPLPAGVTEPGSYTEKDKDVQGRAAAELATIAAGWALLHEVRHLQHQQEGTSADPYEKDPSKQWEEELSCDNFATKFLLQDAQLYARHENAEPELVVRKRQLGIYFALFAMTLLAKGNWGDTQTHPAMQKRIQAVHEAMKPELSAIAFAICQAAFAALNVIWPNAPGALIETLAE